MAWKTFPGGGGDYFALDGQISLVVAVRGRHLFLSNDSDLLKQLLANNAKPATAPGSVGLTYEAFDHSPTEQSRFRTLMGFLDRAGNLGSQDHGGPPSAGQQPAFFSGDIASFSWVFASVSQETIEERDRGATVAQTVRYVWAQ